MIPVFVRCGHRVEWDEATVTALFQLAVEGQGTVKLAKAAGVSDTALRAQWRRRDLDVLRSRRERMRGLFKRWCKGETVPALAEESGMSKSGLRNCWSRNGWYLHDLVSAKKIRSLWARRLGGEKTKALAAEHGRTESWLRMRWRRLGFNPQSVMHRSLLNDRSRMYVKAWGMRVDEHSWSDIKTALGYPHTTRSLRLAVKRWRERNGIAVDQST